MPIFRALFTIDKIWKQPKCPPKDKWIKMGPVCVYTQIHTHTHTHTRTQWDITQAQNIMKYCHVQQHG